MTKAAVERVEPDPWLARAFLDSARSFVDDGSSERNSDASRQLLLHSAAIAACDAVLAVNGRRVTGADGGHKLRLEAAEDLLPDASDGLFVRLDDARMTRNEASYAAGLVPAVSVQEALEAVRELIDLAETHVAPHLPPYLEDDTRA
jgi:hypothetical protein